MKVNHRYRYTLCSGAGVEPWTLKWSGVVERPVAGGSISTLFCLHIWHRTRSGLFPFVVLLLLVGFFFFLSSFFFFPPFCFSSTDYTYLGSCLVGFFFPFLPFVHFSIIIITTIVFLFHTSPFNNLSVKPCFLVCFPSVFNFFFSWE